MSDMKFDNLLVTMSRPSVLDIDRVVRKLEAGLFRLGLLNVMEPESLQSERCETNSMRRMP